MLNLGSDLVTKFEKGMGVKLLHIPVDTILRRFEKYVNASRLPKDERDVIFKDVFKW